MMTTRIQWELGLRKATHIALSVPGHKRLIFNRYWTLRIPQIVYWFDYP